MLRSLLNIIPVASVASCQSATDFVNSSSIPLDMLALDAVLLNKDYKEDEKYMMTRRVRLKKR